MPTISVDKAELYKALGQEYTTEEFEELCFEFGIELDEDTTDQERPIVNGKQEPPQLKIEIPANRYDMLCFEGIALMLNIFREKTPFPDYKLVKPKGGKMQTITVSPDTLKVRPYVSGAILRNIKFTKASYDSFISLQDKLHQNLARQRTLVAIGTHDLDTIKGPFTYEALSPKDIKFAPLNQTKEMNGEELMQFYENDKHLGKYLHIIRDKPVYPVIYDSQRIVCSMPPIINGNHSKISQNTTNVFIEMTGTDRTKLEIVNHIMVAMFSMYCTEPFTIEPVEIISNHNEETRTTPDFKPRLAEAEVDYINNCCGLKESPERICELLTKMCYTAKPSKKDKNILDVSIPVTRADVLHQCDIMEDVAIGYGFNNLPRTSPNKASTIAQPLMINKLGDIVRMEAAMAGWSEVMPLILCSHDENFGWLNRKDDGETAVKLANPKTAEYQVVRTSLLPGLLKTIRENKKHSVPIKVFEVSDVAFKDMSLERKSRNERHFAAAWYGKTSGFEVVHGLLDRVLLMLKTAFLTHEDGLQGKRLDYEVKEDPSKPDGYWIEEIDEPTFFAGHAAAIYLRIDGKQARIGEFGILHPTVLDKFELRYPVSTLEINLEVFL
ncbi:phenylalanyl-tRNA synthetase [Mollisia scopiformis]|uniref:Phenylalanine--tRNA ligase beta subunit n=1 Tax=Mollisia scopiformis TaxID=149040 RepID=A0A194WXI0_MOLSC|nr:phenylalanyl-tRNA synthetase [Mollisia scopiformis]KUJ12688.1 phenylalanyl-tRNA synthetase [Mollisia scopiformis]